MVRAYLGIGSNLGDRKENISKSLKLLAEKCKILKVSSLYDTEPVGYKKQDMFLNGVVFVETGLKPMQLLLFLQSIEKKLGRVKTIRNGPRIIDLDILFYDDEVIEEEGLIVPHPRLHERKFVLEPLNEIAPDFVHPVLRKRIRELLDMID